MRFEEWAEQIARQRITEIAVAANSEPHDATGFSITMNAGENADHEVGEIVWVIALHRFQAIATDHGLEFVGRLSSKVAPAKASEFTGCEAAKRDAHCVAQPELREFLEGQRFGHFNIRSLLVTF